MLQWRYEWMAQGSEADTHFNYQDVSQPANQHSESQTSVLATQNRVVAQPSNRSAGHCDSSGHGCGLVGRHGDAVNKPNEAQVMERALERDLQTAVQQREQERLTSPARHSTKTSKNSSRCMFHCISLDLSHEVCNENYFFCSLLLFYPFTCYFLLFRILFYVYARKWAKKLYTKCTCILHAWN